jgi:hypothetical protein
MWKPEGKRPFEKWRHRWEDVLKWALKKLDRKTWTELIWFRTGTRGGVL